ncbi:retrovirus-related pol polyprotein from transposon TNT 1-94, partial [Tanacetum coccineum]
MAILENTNFFMASSTIPTIYIQQFWDTMCFDSSTGFYNCQLDEEWFNLHKDILGDALDITPTNDNNPFVAPPSSDTVIEYVNTLGYPVHSETCKTIGYDRPRHLVLQILGGIIHRSNIDYAERIWEEFVQSIQTFLTDKKNLATDSHGKKKSSHLLILSVRFVRKDAEYQRYLDEEHDKAEEGEAITEFPKTTKVAKQSKPLALKAPKVTKPADDKAPKPTSSQPPKLTSTPTESSKKDQGEGVLEKEPAYNEEEANLQQALEISLKEHAKQTQGPARPVVLREPDSRRFQLLPDV